MGWFGVRTICRFCRGPVTTYEERLTLWQAADLDAAIALAEGEAEAYAADLDGCVFAGLAQAYQLGGPPGHGAEVFSLMRDSDLATGEYLDAFFDTGRERQLSRPVPPAAG